MFKPAEKARTAEYSPDVSPFPDHVTRESKPFLFDQ